MNSIEMVTDAVFQAVDRVNQQLAPELRVKKSPDTVIFGPSSPLDSLGYVNFVAAVETQCEERFGRFISLAEASSDESNSVQTLGQIVELVVRLLDGKGLVPQ
jgi:hypothetical protein